MSERVIGSCPRDGRQWDNQCARCGSSMTFEDCDNCGGEGCVDDDDWDAYGDETMTCDWCNGTGGHWVCLASPEWCIANPREFREETQRGVVEWFTFDAKQDKRSSAAERSGR